jgi:hypothetical protein
MFWRIEGLSHGCFSGALPQAGSACSQQDQQQGYVRDRDASEVLHGTLPPHLGVTDGHIIEPDEVAVALLRSLPPCLIAMAQCVIGYLCNCSVDVESEFFAFANRSS